MVKIDSLEDFALLILAHMATVDGSLHPTERDTILMKMQEIFPQISETEQRLDQAFDLLRKLGKDLSEQAIDENASQLTTLTAEQKEILYVFLFDVLNADGRVNEEETRMLRKLKGFLIQ